MTKEPTENRKFFLPLSTGKLAFRCNPVYGSVVAHYLDYQFLREVNHEIKSALPGLVIVLSKKRALSPGYETVFWRPKPEAWWEPGLQTLCQDLSVSHLCLLQAKLEVSDCLHFLYLMIQCGGEPNPRKKIHCTCLGLGPVLDQAAMVGTRELWWPGNRSQYIESLLLWYPGGCGWCAGHSKRRVEYALSEQI